MFCIHSGVMVGRIGVFVWLLVTHAAHTFSDVAVMREPDDAGELMHAVGCCCACGLTVGQEVCRIVMQRLHPLAFVRCMACCMSILFPFARSRCMACCMSLIPASQGGLRKAQIVGNLSIRLSALTGFYYDGPKDGWMRFHPCLPFHLAMNSEIFSPSPSFIRQAHFS